MGTLFSTIFEAPKFLDRFATLIRFIVISISKFSPGHVSGSNFWGVFIGIATIGIATMGQSTAAIQNAGSSLRTSPKPRRWNCKVEQPKMCFQLLCGLVSANPWDNKLLHSTWSISLRLKRPSLLLGEFGWHFFLFLCQCNCYCCASTTTDTVGHSLRGSSPELSCNCALAHWSCTFHTWFSRLPACISCANVH